MFVLVEICVKHWWHIHKSKWSQCECVGENIGKIILTDPAKWKDLEEESACVYFSLRFWFSSAT